MRSSIASVVIVAALAAGCETAGRHELKSLRFSDSASLANAVHTDTFDSRFELGHAPFVHAHVDVEYAPGAAGDEVTLTCEIAGPAGSHLPVVEPRQRLPEKATSTTWMVPLTTRGQSRWVAGTYNVTCASPSDMVKGTFEIVDTSALVRPAARPPAVPLPGGSSGLPGPRPPAPAPAPVKLLPWPQEDDLLKHDHALPVVPASPAPVPTVFRPRLYSLQSKDDAAGVDGTQFDAATLKWVGWEIELAGDLRGSLKGCVVQRRRTGVSRPAGLSLRVSPTAVEFLGRAGGDEPLWIPGEYQLRCDAEGFSVAPVDFTVVGRSQGHPRWTVVATSLAPGVTPVDVRTFQYASDPGPPGDHRYFTTFVGYPRWIGAEVKLELSPQVRPFGFTFTCNYFSARGQLIGIERANIQIPAGEKQYFMWVSWGNPHGTFWLPGNHYVECDADGRFVAGRFFDISR